MKVNLLESSDSNSKNEFDINLEAPMLITLKDEALEFCAFIEPIPLIGT